ncbi:MAG: hypothetical protein KDC44_11220, partial [Phaeodactylibacter sp.]|nr:hypothetical protein [Phaeodactylibacter sp.]
MVPNIGWKFYYQYYANLDFVEGQAIFQGAPSVQAKKEGLTVEVAFDDYVDLINDVLPKLGKHGFELTTIYPGLL